MKEIDNRIKTTCCKDCVLKLPTCDLLVKEGLEACDCHKLLKNPFKNKKEVRRFFGLSVSPEKKCCEKCFIELTYKEAMVRNNCKNADCSCHQIKKLGQ